jgi:hypothetical protein
MCVGREANRSLRISNFPGTPFNLFTLVAVVFGVIGIFFLRTFRFLIGAAFLGGALIDPHTRSTPRL